MKNEEKTITDKNYSTEEIKEIVYNLDDSSDIVQINKIYKITRKKFLDSFKRFETDSMTAKKGLEEQELLKTLYNYICIKIENKLITTNEENKNQKIKKKEKIK